MDPNTPAQPAPGMSDANSEQMASMQKRIEELQKQHPESSDKLGSGFWLPGMQLGADVNVCDLRHPQSHYAIVSYYPRFTGGYSNLQPN